MSVSKREGMTLVFFLSVLAVAPLAMALTRAAVRMRIGPFEYTCFTLGALFLIITILTLGLED